MPNKGCVMLMLAFAMCVAAGNPVTQPGGISPDGEMQTPIIRVYGGGKGIVKVETVNVQTNGGVVLQTQRHTPLKKIANIETQNVPTKTNGERILRVAECSLTAQKGDAAQDTNTWVEVVKVNDSSGSGGRISGKNFCGLVFGDVYPDKCERLRLSTPFFIFDELDISYYRDGALKRISASKEISCRYIESNVLQVAMDIKETMETHFDILLLESKNRFREDRVDPELLLLYDTDEIRGKMKYFCEARVCVRRKVYGKYGRRLLNPIYAISFSIVDESEFKGSELYSRNVHERYSPDNQATNKVELGTEKLPPVVGIARQISRPYPCEDLKASVTNQLHYDWGDIDNKYVVGTEACRAAVELQKRGRHMRTMNLRDKEITQEAVVELANRIDALEKEIKALKANQKP